MSNSLQIKIKRHLKDDLYTDDLIILKPTTSITVWGNENFNWEGSYMGKNITVTLPKGAIEEDAEITKPTNLNINDQIYKELKRVLRQLN